MGRVLHGIEKGLRLYAENGQDPAIDIIFGADAPDGLGDQLAAPIGSLYIRQDGELYQKIASVGEPEDYQLNAAAAASLLLSAGYTPVNGDPATGDSFEEAIEKLDGNQKDLITLSGVAQGAENLGAFTGDIISDDQTVKAALQDLETELVDTRDNVDDLIVLSGVAENAQDLGAWTSPVDLLFSATSTVKALFQRIGELLMQLRGVRVAGITTLATVDEVPTATVAACKWLVEAFEDATPANRQALEVYALNNGSASDNTVYAKLKVGANFNLSISVDVSGGQMRLRAASTSAGVTVTARRIEAVKTVL